MPLKYSMNWNVTRNSEERRVEAIFNNLQDAADDPSWLKETAPTVIIRFGQNVLSSEAGSTEANRQEITDRINAYLVNLLNGCKALVD